MASHTIPNHITTEQLNNTYNDGLFSLYHSRLSRLDGLEHLTKLEVLDLHGNQLHHLQGLAHLKVTT